jgi:hypothetical protein
MGKYNVKLMYRPQEKKHHIELIKDNFFGNDKGYGYFGKDKKQYDFVLEDGINNLYEPIRNEALKYYIFQILTVVTINFMIYLMQTYWCIRTILP